MTGARVAIVTGAARNIGRAIALQLAKDGLHVALNDVAPAQGRLDKLRREIEEGGGKAITVPADVTSEPAVKRMIDQTAAHFGALDVMVANAGLFVWKKLLDTTVEDWHRLHGVNGLGVFLCYKHAALKMKEIGSRSGRIIGAASGAGRLGVPMGAVYCQTKFGVRGLTQALAQDLASTGITVNCYCPGWVDTDMVREQVEASGDVAAFYAEAKARTPVGYLGQPEDVANVVSFLVSPKAHYITGQVDVNGGLIMN
ncbi:hypothetical protein HDZ31DRAFT_82582 [Schizophyllum fasciatum]